MKIMKCIVLLYVFSIITACAPGTRHIWEIPDRQLNYIVLYRAHPEFGTSVVYNPDYCEQIGKACDFFLSHAYAHQRNHDTPLPPNAYPKSTVKRADCWAARYVNPESVFAAYNFLINNNGEIPVSGDPLERAENIKQCAIKYENWLG